MSTRHDALASITKALGWKSEEKPPWPELVIKQLEADGFSITRTDSGPAEHIDGFNKIRTARIGDRIQVDCYRQDTRGEWQHIYGGQHPIEATTGVQ